MSKVKWVRLGDYIERIDERNSDNLVKVVKSVSVFKEFRDTGAKVDKNDLHNYKIVWPGDISFVQTTGNEKCLAAALSEFSYPIVVTSVNEVLRTKRDYLLPEYLMLYFLRKETDRYARYNSWGSARETFKWDDMCNISIPLPSLSEQQKVVNAWKAFREIKEQNEAKAAPLMQLCQSYIQELKHKYPAQEIGPYIEESDKRNTAGIYGEESVRGLATSKGMIDTKANLTGVSLSSYKLVCPYEIAFVPDTSRRGDKMSLGLNETDESFLVSSISCVFDVKDKEKLLPAFLYLWFCRPEFDRYARFNSWGSAREAFSFEDMKRTEVPIPPLDVQRAIVNIYKCANEAKQIAAEADRLSREVCPALLQHVINS